MKQCDISVVLGSKNRKQLIRATIESIRKNKFNGSMEIIVIDGGSTDGTCDWLAKQRDILTIMRRHTSNRLLPIAGDKRPIVQDSLSIACLKPPFVDVRHPVLSAWLLSHCPSWCGNDSDC